MLPRLVLTRLDGSLLSNEQLQDKVLLIVNVASRCGFTPQYAQLQRLHDHYASHGLVVLAFPCNQFGMQEPGSHDEIAQFCSLNYGVTFAVMEKCEVNGDAAHPLFKWLKQEKPGLFGTEGIKWNFTKFLVDRRGNVVGRYAPQVSPEQLQETIEQLLRD